MAWTEAAQAKYRRRTTRYESDLTDAEVVGLRVGAAP